MSVDVSKAEIGTGPHFKRGPLSARLDGFDDVQMNPAAAGASHGPVFGAGAAGDDAQHRERGGAIRTAREHRRGLEGLFGKGQRHSAGQRAAGSSVVGPYGFANRGLKRSI